MASLTRGTTFVTGVANDVTADKLHALVDAATPTSGFIQDRTSETVIASNDTLLFGDASASDDLKRITVSNLFKTDVSITSATGTAGTVAIGPTGDTNTGIFFPAADTIAFSEGGAEAMRIDSSGNVGIGTSSPASKLDIYTNSAAGFHYPIFLSANNSVAAKTNYLQLGFSVQQNLAGSETGGFDLKALRNNTAVYLANYEGAAGLAAWRFYTEGSERMRIDSSGNVGIGTTSPATQLQINSSATTYSDQLRIRNTNYGNADIGVGSGIMAIATDNSNIAFYTSSNLGTTGSALPNNERLRIDSSGRVGIGTTNPSSVGGLFSTVGSSNTGIGYFRNLATSGITADQLQVSVSQSANLANFYFSRFYSDVVSSATVKHYVRGDGDGYFAGNVGIGTVSPSAQLELSTDSAKKPSTNTWTIASDQRLKTNITNADNDRCYEIVKQVPLKRYTWKNEVYSQDKVKDRSKLGWIAQDVEAVFPKAVGTNRFAYNQVFEDVVTPELDSDGNAVLDENGVAKTKTEKRLVSEEVIEDCKDLNSDQIYAAMYGTIQKLIEKVETLEAKVAALEAA